MKRLGIIDIGSNSMRLIIIRIRPDGAFKLIDEVRDSVRLGEKINKVNVLSTEKMEAAMKTLRFFLSLCEALEVDEIICTATEAVRRATNQAEFLKMVRDRLGLEIRVLTGEEEAYFDYFGAIHTLDLTDCLLMDIGGSSTELVLVKQKEAKRLISLPFGTISLTQMFQLQAPMTEATRKKLGRYLHEYFDPIPWLKDCGLLVGIGGSFRNLAKIDRKQKNYPLDVTHNYPMSGEDIRDIYDKIGGMTVEERISVKGLSGDRADIIPGALAEMVAILDIAGITDVRISGSGLREGLYYHRILNPKEPAGDVLDFSLNNMMKNYELNQDHANHVWKIAGQLYQQLGKELKIDMDRQKVLKTAALLHDCGINVSYYDHHKHSFYNIINSQINGLTQKELVMAAWVASLHRKDEMRITAPYSKMLGSKEIGTVRKLGMILRIAESLDRGQNGNISEVQGKVEKNTVKLKLRAKTYPGLEIKDAQNAASAFQKIFKKQLVLEEA